MYKPSGSIALSEVTMPQIRLGIQGFPATGKTFAATTFPNTVFLSTDRGLGAHIGRADILEVPFYDAAFVDKIAKRNSPASPPNRRDAIKKWIHTEAPQLTAEQTLVVDNSTGLQSAFDTQQALEPQYTKTGKVDDFAFWRLKIEWFNELHEALKALKCHVVYLCHETPAKNKEGDYNGKLRPLLSGQFGDQIIQHYTDWFRQHAVEKPKTLDKVKLEEWGMKSQAEFTALMNRFPRQTMYIWQLDGDDLCDCKTSSLVNFPKFIKADYETFVSYMRKPTISTQ